MPEENERNPRLDLKSVVKLNKPIELTLKSRKPVASGETTFGEWFLWRAEVKDMLVFKPKSDEKIENYSGEVVFFTPNDKINEKLLEFTGSEKTGVKVKFSKEPFEMDDGRIVGRWGVEKVGEGEISPSTLSPTEKKLVEDVRDAVEQGLDISFDEFVQLSKEEAYSSANISEDRAKELYNIIFG